MQIEHPHVINHVDLENLTEQTYGHTIDIQQGEYANNSYMEYDAVVVEKEDDEWFRYFAGQIESLKAGTNPYPDLECVLGDLCTKNLIPAGSYLIKIWW
jgi:hypothetical protein